MDGKERGLNFKSITGYVTQEDVIMGTLTVKENIMFSANMRLPSKLSKEIKKFMVEEVLDELGLTDVGDSRVGTEYLRGVSGGERKRTCIGMELIIRPSILFLDEPTSGLDSSTSYSVICLLNELAKKGRIVVLSIHQARYGIFKMIDNLLLLGNGSVIYHGPTENALPYFNSIGYQCEEFNNPADFFLDVINGDFDKTKSFIESSKEHNISISKAFEMSDRKSRFIKQRSDKLARLFEKSKYYARVVEEIHQRNASINQPSCKKIQYITSFTTQILHLSHRTMINSKRNPASMFAQIFVMILLSILNGLVYYHVENNISGLTNRVGSIFSTTLNMVFINLAAIELFIKEKPLFMHENTGRYYRVSSYFIAKFFCDIIPIRIFPAMVYGAIVYWMIGLHCNLASFFTFLAFCCLTSLTTCSLAFAISAGIKNFTLAQVTLAFLCVVMMIFSGFMVNLDSIKPYLQWIKWLSIVRYSFDGLLINELQNLTICQNYPFYRKQKFCSKEIARYYLRNYQGITYETNWDLWQNFLALFCLFLIFTVIAYVQLRLLRKTK
ncbi:DgyrCDS7104 [Dimorphilus gyrociliatus]|uniref:DgyrCDS7104 n=1 Tax=Dimorphilus gyrociliatus TaxID=2664684 RepID=A0A7I8VRP2_9ANNE|nr:DgyrCDS7104 [Dimorphilus gyrociliatus]